MSHHNEPPAAGGPPPAAPAPYGYGYPPAWYPPPSRPANATAIAALAVGVTAVTSCLPFGFVAIILGHVARRQIRERGKQGDGMALAGIITGWINTGIWLLGFGTFLISLLITALAAS